MRRTILEILKAITSASQMPDQATTAEQKAAFKSEEHLQEILSEASKIVDGALGS